MKKILFLLLLIASAANAQTFTPFPAIRLTASTECTECGRVLVQDAVTGRVYFVENENSAFIPYSGTGAKKITGDLQFDGDQSVYTTGTFMGMAAIKSGGLGSRFSAIANSATDFVAQINAGGAISGVNTDVIGQYTAKTGLAEILTQSALGSKIAYLKITAQTATSYPLFKVYGSGGFKGIEYESDYSASYSSRSVPDVAWVTAQIAAAGGGGQTYEDVLTLDNESFVDAIHKTDAAPGIVSETQLSGQGLAFRSTGDPGAETRLRAFYSGQNIDVFLPEEEGTLITREQADALYQPISGGGEDPVLPGYYVNATQFDRFDFTSYAPIVDALYIDAPTGNIYRYDGSEYGLVSGGGGGGGISSLTESDGVDVSDNGDGTWNVGLGNITPASVAAIGTISGTDITATGDLIAWDDINAGGSIMAIGTVSGSNLSGTNTGDVIGDGEGYISVSADQIITAYPVNLATTNVTGTLPVGKGGTGMAGVGTTGQLLRSTGSAYEWFTPTYISSNQTISFSPTGDVTGTASGSTSLSPALTIGTGAVTSAKIADGTITNADINAAASIDASKINTGAVSNTEFNYLDGVTSSIQTQLDSKSGKPEKIILNNDYTLTSTTSPQKIFNVGANGNGQLNAKANTLYHFVMQVGLNSLPTTGSTFSIGFGGTATITSLLAFSDGAKNVDGPNSGQSTKITGTSLQAVVSSSTSTTGKLIVHGYFRTSTAGTVQPQISMTSAAAAVVEKDSGIVFTEEGPSSFTHTSGID